MPQPPLTVNSNDWDRRADGSPKGNGFFGAIIRPGTRDVSSELSNPLWEKGNPGEPGYEKGPEIPTMVPTLVPREMDYLLHVPPDELNSANPLMMHFINQKAQAFAKKRQAAGLPFFATPVEENDRLMPQYERAAVKMPSGDIHLPNESGVIDPRLKDPIAQLMLQRSLNAGPTK